MHLCPLKKEQQAFTGRCYGLVWPTSRSWRWSRLSPWDSCPQSSYAGLSYCIPLGQEEDHHPPDAQTTLLRRLNAANLGAGGESSSATAIDADGIVRIIIANDSRVSCFVIR